MFRPGRIWAAATSGSTGEGQVAVDPACCTHENRQPDVVRPISGTGSHVPSPLTYPRAADLNKLADAWQPLYPTLSPERKRRMAALTIFVFREMRNGLEQRRLQSDE